MLDENPDEDFGLPEELASAPRDKRAVLAASKPLWHLVARPHILHGHLRVGRGPKFLLAACYCAMSASRGMSCSPITNTGARGTRIVDRRSVRTT